MGDPRTAKISLYTEGCNRPVTASALRMMIQVTGIRVVIEGAEHLQGRPIIIL
jgi:hypothetical protein